MFKKTKFKALKKTVNITNGLIILFKETPADWKIVTKRQPDKTEAVALEFAWKAIKYVKSHGIIITNDHAIVHLIRNK